MKRFTGLVGSSWIMGGFVWACGPFFADTVLNHPMAALDVPPVSYLSELAEYSGVEIPNHIGEMSTRTAQVPVEIDELEEFWRKAGVNEEEISLRAEFYCSRRTALLERYDLVGWKDFHPGNDQKPIPDGLDDRFPRDVVDYFEGSRRLVGGDKQGARNIWNDILERPAAERMLRGAWAAWMLAMTSEGEEEAVLGYRKVIELVDQGSADVLGLAGASYGWLSTLDAKDDPLESIRLTYRAVRLGHHWSIVDLRRRCGKLLSSTDPVLLAAAAADPEIRGLLNLELYARLDGPTYDGLADGDRGHSWDGWLAALKKDGSVKEPAAAKVAWALYSSGRFDEANDWLALADDKDPCAAWLRGKLALRGGHVDRAAREFKTSADLWRGSSTPWKPDNPELWSLWNESGAERQASRQGRLLADLGMANLALQRHTRALDELLEGGYWEDAAYIAERVLTTRELQAHLEKAASDWSPEGKAFWSGKPMVTRWGDSVEYKGPVDPASFETYESPWTRGWPVTEKDNLRYLLARRLAREWRLDEARKWMPPPLVPLFDHYVALHRARLSGRYSGAEYAAIGWREACILRVWGMELMGTETAPDAASRDGSFEAPDVAGLRLHWSGVVKFAGVDPPMGIDKTPVLGVSKDEARRVLSHQLPEERRFRFHYRFIAADAAWKAAAALPDNHPQLAAMYNSAGLWIERYGLKSADRFYQAMVRRCKDTEEGRQADAKRWFLKDLARPGDLPGLPEGLRPKSPAASTGAEADG